MAGIEREDFSCPRVFGFGFWVFGGFWFCWVSGFFGFLGFWVFFLFFWGFWVSGFFFFEILTFSNLVLSFWFWSGGWVGSLGWVVGWSGVA